jgi:hypothetical protein
VRCAAKVTSRKRKRRIRPDRRLRFRLVRPARRLQIHFERRVPRDNTQPERILAGQDCFCISKGPFRPNGKHKPAEKTFAPNVVNIPAGQEQTFELAEKWENPRPWWPGKVFAWTIHCGLPAWDNGSPAGGPPGCGLP